MEALLEGITHSELTEIGKKWLKKHAQNILLPNCAIVVSEYVAASESREIPDIIGWCTWASVLIEVKVSRSDFLADHKKPFRINQDEGMGNFRYYLCPEGLIKEIEVPGGWGLIYFNPTGLQIVKKAKKLTANLKGERSMLYSIARKKNA